jgi:hypothetical protein
VVAVVLTSCPRKPKQWFKEHVQQDGGRPPPSDEGEMLPSRPGARTPPKFGREKHLGPFPQAPASIPSASSRRT